MSLALEVVTLKKSNSEKYVLINSKWKMKTSITFHFPQYDFENCSIFLQKFVNGLAITQLDVLLVLEFLFNKFLIEKNFPSLIILSLVEKLNGKTTMIHTRPLSATRWAEKFCQS